MPRPQHTDLTIAVLARNEADRFLPSALEAWCQIADRIVFLDDTSTDNTKELARAAGALVFDAGSTARAWGAETPMRDLLWRLANLNTPDGGFIAFLDCDMVFAKDPRLFLSGKSGAWSFPLFDLWGEAGGKLLYRDDRFWAAHNNPRIWLVRKQPEPAEGWQWSGRGIHSGHLPTNYQVEHSLGVAPRDYGILHYGYIHADYRAAKVQQYLSVKDQLGKHELQHALSIADGSPRLLPLHFDPVFKLMRVDALQEAA